MEIKIDQYYINSDNGIITHIVNTDNEVIYYQHRNMKSKLSCSIAVFNKYIASDNVRKLSEFEMLAYGLYNGTKQIL